MVEPNALGFLAMDPDQPMPYVGAARLVSDVSSAGIDAFVAASGPGSGSELANVELRSLGGALARHTPGHGARATLEGDYLMFAVGGVFSPDGYGEVQRQAEAVSQAMSPWDAGTRYLNFEEADGVDAQVSSMPTRGACCAPCGPTGIPTACSSPTTRSRIRSQDAAGLQDRFRSPAAPVRAGA